MANILTNKWLSGEIKLKDVIEWLEKPYIESAKSEEISEICSQKDFITYFLNTLHDLTTRDQWNDSSLKKTTQNISNDSARARRSFFNATQDFSNNTFNLTCTTSTPKQKSQNASNFEKDCSPIQSSSKHTNGTLCLGDFIVTKKKSTSKKNKKGKNKSPENVQRNNVKKLKPTNLNESKFTSMQFKGGNSYNFQDVQEISPDRTSRDFMKREILVSKVKAPETGSLSDKMVKKKSVNPKNVRYKEEVDKTVDIYVFLLNNGFVLSLVGELYFIINLLSNKNSCDISGCDEDKSIEVVNFDVIFNGVDNITYFACSVISNILNLVECLDKQTLKYLCENESLKAFSPQCIKELENITEEKEENNLNLYNSNGKKNICFVLETDNQSNFPSEGSFQGFKRQRDMFYEILRTWEDNHMQPNWDFDANLGRSVRQLVCIYKDPVNFIRLSRLFMEQLLNACSKKGRTVDKNSGVLSSLSNVDKDKIDRLKSRLTQKPTNGINSVPDFCGYQQFFRDFIVSSYNPTFIRHLSNVLIAEIVELNTTTFDTLDADENDTELDTKKAFVTCLKSLKTLAKFLGFIESMPYKNEACHSAELMEFQIKIRNQVTPNLDINALLEESTASGKLTLFIPWLCEYLAMLDPVTLRTKYYAKFVEKILNLYRSLTQKNAVFPSFYNAMLVKFSLGWLFELNNFPHDVFFEKLTHPGKFDCKLPTFSSLDKLTIVDNNILYFFCPYLDEFKKLLANETTVKDRTTSRHITPLTKVDSPKESTNKKFEVQLEENFFNSHPSSLKKTVEFVAERVASACVKHVCHQVVPEYKKKFVALLKDNLNAWSTEEQLSEEEYRSRCTKLAEEKIKELQSVCHEEVNKIISNRVRASIEALLPLDCLPQIENICVSAGERMCEEKVEQWSSTHIVVGLLTKEVKSEIQGVRAKSAYLLPPSGSGAEHQAATDSGAHILNKTRLLTASLLAGRGELRKEIVINNLNDVYESVTQRNDLNDMVLKMLCSQLVEFMLLLVSRQPSMISETQEYFTRMWKLRGEEAESLFENLISVKNFLLISKSRSVQKSLDALAVTCVALLRDGLLSSDSFESQCMGLFKYDLTDRMLSDVTLFLRNFVDLYKIQCKSSKFTFLLEFLSDYCSDL